MFNEEDVADCVPDQAGFNPAKKSYTYSKKNRSKPEIIPSTSQYIELKNVSQQLTELHSSIDLTAEPDVSNVTLGTDIEGFVLETAEKEFNVTEDLIDVLENNLSENESCTETARKRGSKSHEEHFFLGGQSNSDEAFSSSSVPTNDVATKTENLRPVVVKVMKGKKIAKAVINKTWDALKGNEDAATIKADSTKIVNTSAFKGIEDTVTFKADSTKVVKTRGRPKTKPKPTENKISKSGKIIEYQHCQLCDYKTRSNTSFIQHQYIHNVINKVEVYKCDDCNFICNNHNSLLGHRANHAQQYISYKCTFCEEAFNKKNLGLTHVLMHKEIPDLEEHLYCLVYNSLTDLQYYECFQCEYQQQEDTGMIAHILDHQIEQPLNPIVARFKCSRCDYYTKSEDMIARHNVLHHLDKKKSSGGRKRPCAAGSIIKLEVKEEGVLELNANKPILTCELCNYETRNQRSLINHTSLKHNKKSKTKEKPGGEKTLYFCNECPYSTYRKLNMPRHALVHKTKADIEIFECPHCFFETKHRRSYVRHMKDIHMVVV